MMARKKYYVTFGPLTNILLAENEYRACILTFRKYFDEDTYRDTLPAVFIVSQRGFDAHNDDTIVDVGTITGLLLIAGQEVNDEQF